MDHGERKWLNTPAACQLASLPTLCKVVHVSGLHNFLECTQYPRVFRWSYGNTEKSSVAFFFYCRKLRIVNFFTLEEFACAYLFIFRSLQCLDCTRSFLTLLVFIENITPQHCKLNRMPKGQKFRKSLNFLQRHRSGKLGQIFKGHNLNNIRCPKTEDHVIFYLNLKMKAQSGMWNKFFSRFAIHFISYFSSKNFESVCFVRLFIFR